VDLKVTEATEQAIHYIGTHLREIDRKEATLVEGKHPLNQLRESWNVSDICKVVRERFTGLPIAIVGRGTIETPDLKLGVPWMVSTDDLKEHSRSFLRACPHWVNFLQGDCDLLMNWCLPENITSIIWLKKMGFEFAKEPAPYGAFGVPFIRFWRYL